MSLTVEPTNKCNYQCRFCPNGDKEHLKLIDRSAGDMPMDLYRKLIDDIVEAGAQIKSFSLHKDGEPLLNRRLEEMIKIARDSGCIDDITVTSNGSLLSGQRAGKLLECGLTYLRISVESIRDERFKWITRTKYDADRLYRNVREFRKMRDERGLEYPRIYVKIVAFPVIMEEIEEFKKLYEGIADDVNIETPMNWNGSGEKNFLEEVDPDGECNKNEVFGYYENCGEFSEKFCFPLPWYSMSVNQNGQVGICGVDWNRQTIIGDLRKQHLIYDIWNGNEMIKFREYHIKNLKHMTKSCANCEFLNSYPDNIDDFVINNPKKALSKAKY